MLIKKEDTSLLVIDVQEKLHPAIADANGLEKRLAWLISVCRDMSLPIAISEQYPKGLGPTLPSLMQRLDQPTVVEKLHFSCVAGHCLPPSQLLLSQFILCGMETHVCVLQTAMDLLALGKQVFVVADACGSRNPTDHQLGLERMRTAGIQIVSREMVLFELLHQSGTEQFKTASKQYLQGVQP